MPKTTTTYWNPLAAGEEHRWRWVEGLEQQVQELILSEDPVSGEITRLTRFLPGADTSSSGARAHDFPEEVFIVSGSLVDVACGRRLEAGHYASRPPGELHGPFHTEDGCVVLDVSFPQRGGTTPPEDG